MHAEQERFQALAQAERERQQAEREAERERLQAVVDAERQRLEIIAASERERAVAAAAAATAAAAAEEQRIRAAAEVKKERLAASATLEKQRFDAIVAAERDRAATAVASSAANVDCVRAAAALEAEKRFDLERQRITAEREREVAEKQALEAVKAAELQRLQAECGEERARRLEGEKQLQIVSQFSSTFSPSLLTLHPPIPHLILLSSHLVDYYRRATHLAARHHLCLYLLLIDGCLSVACLVLHSKSTMHFCLQALHTALTSYQQLRLILYLRCHQ